MLQQKISRQMIRATERRLKKVKIIPSDVDLTASTGLGICLEIFAQSPFAGEFEKCLPERVSHRSIGSFMLGLMLLAGHLRGVENLSGMNRVRQDPYLEELFYDEMAAVRTLQDFLYDFTDAHVEKLNLLLNNMAKAIFEQLQYQLPEGQAPDQFILDMDSSHHVHYGEAVEGVAYNYKNQWCLESHLAFDQLGLCHGIELRPGNTKPGAGAAEFIERVFRDHRQQRRRRLEAKDFFRGDSAYCNQLVIRKCLDLGILFTVTAHKATTQWDRHMNKAGLAWQPWEYSEAEKKKAAKSGQELPTCEVTRFYWEPGWSETTLKLPIVVTRTWMKYSQLKDKSKKLGQRNFFELDTVKEEGDWEYYAIVTNFDLSKWSLQEVVEHHRKRGHAENFVREGKYNFHLKNFPCEKLLPNKAWVCMAQIAHNLIRWIAILENPEHPSFAKRIRDDFMFIPGKLARGSHEVILRVNLATQEVIEKICGWQFPGFNPARIFAGVPSG
jgi:Transposase DDE domain group 1